MQPFGKRITDIFESNRITSLQKYQKLPHSRKNKIISQLYNALTTNRSKISSLSNDDGIIFHLGNLIDRDISSKNINRYLLRKLSFFGKKVVVSIPFPKESITNSPETHPINGRQKLDTKRFVIWGHPHRKNHHQANGIYADNKDHVIKRDYFKDVIDFILYLKPAIDSDILTLIPKYKGDKDNLDNKSFFTPASFASRDIERQFTRNTKPGHALMQSGYIRFYLPNFTNVTFKDICKIRKKEPFYYNSFHDFFANSFRKAQELSQPSEVMECLKELDNKIRELHQREIELLNACKIKAITTTSLACVLTFSIFIPQKYQHIISWLYGGAGLGYIDVVSDLYQKNSDFKKTAPHIYAPWILHKKSKEIIK